eukprot:692647-Rhodomonas_salina.2
MSEFSSVRKRTAAANPYSSLGSSYQRQEAKRIEKMCEALAQHEKVPPWYYHNSSLLCMFCLEGARMGGIEKHEYGEGRDGAEGGRGGREWRKGGTRGHDRVHLFEKTLPCLPDIALHSQGMTFGNSSSCLMTASPYFSMVKGRPDSLLPPSSSPVPSSPQRTHPRSFLLLLPSR